MKYFNNIHSLRDLKKQFRALAIANHPDKGGDTAVMQEINAEFDALFAVWKNRPDTQVTEEERQETGSTYRRRFYTANGWEGCRYDGNLRTTDIAARVRVYAKEKYPEFKFSVRSEYYSGGSSIHLKLVSGPVPAFNDDAPRQYISTMSEISEKFGLTSEVHAVMSDIVSYCNSFNYDDSDSQIDYFDTNFYLHIYVGTFSKPYEVKQPRAKKVTGKAGSRAERIEGEAGESVAPSCADPESVAVLVVDYSAKAIAVIGDTAPIKDDLKALGGRFNARLTVEGEKVAGWIFSKSKEADVMAYVKKLNVSAEPMAADPDASEPMAAPEAVETEKAQDIEQTQQEAPKFWAQYGRMGCVVCNGLVWYIAPGDWVAVDEVGVFCDEEGEPLAFAGEFDVMRNAAKRDEGRRGVFFLHEREAYKFAEELQKKEAESMATPEPMKEAEPIEAETVAQSTEEGAEEQTAERMKEITNGLESLRGLDESGILEKLTAAGDVLKQSPEFWRMLNEAADPSAALSKALLSHLLIIGRNENKQGAA